MKRMTVMLLVILVAQTGAWAAGQERIIDFSSTVTVNKDASLIVEETITVQAGGEKIKHGIYRDFPTLYRGPWQTYVNVPFDVLSVERDGAPDDWHTGRLDNGIRVYVGRSDVLVSEGEHTYKLKYRTDRQVGFFADRDELYWNATGNGWEFAIEHASATISLPAGTPADKMTLDTYIGPQGARGKAFTSSIDAAGRAVFSTTRLLRPHEGLTVVVSWPKGFVSPPAFSWKLINAFRDNLGLLVGVVGTALVALYFLIAWGKVGIDPKKGTIIPLFEPPKEISPAAARYLTRMGYDNKCMTAAVVSMAVKGAIEVEEKSGEYTLKSGHSAVTLAPEEKHVLEAISENDGLLVLKQENHSEIQSAIEAFKRQLKKAFGTRYFVRNTPYYAAGLAASALVLVATAVLSGGWQTPPFLFLCVWLTIWTLGVFMLGYAVAASWKGALNGRGMSSSLGQAIFLTLFALPFFAAEIFVGGLLVHMSSMATIPVALALGVVNGIFHHIIRAYTPDGRRLMDQLEGFRMYLAATEADHVNVMQAPAKTEALFEKYLPYAIALDVEKKWSAQFAEVLQRASSAPGGQYPGWYSGSPLSYGGTAGFASALGGALSGAISSSSTAPGSSSGFGGGGGGGGSSGGGGGGGGGGGW